PRRASDDRGIRSRAAEAAATTTRSPPARAPAGLALGGENGSRRRPTWCLRCSGFSRRRPGRGTGTLHPHGPAAPVRIVLSNASPAWGGVHRVTEILARGLQERGHELLLLCRPGSRLEG